MSNNPWRIDLFGGLRLLRGGTVITRFRTRQTGLLLAYLALYPDQDHPRDALAELLWPENDLETAKNKLRLALHALRGQRRSITRFRAAPNCATSAGVRLPSFRTSRSFVMVCICSHFT